MSANATARTKCYKATTKVAIALLAALVLGAGCGKKTPKVYKVGILCGLDYIDALPESFKSEMRKHGYIEGKNIFYDPQRTNFEPAREKQILEKFVRDKADLIFTMPTEVSMLAKSAARGTGIPVLFAFANIEGTGLVDSVGNPGGNITGVRYPGPDIAVKRFEIMRKLAPKAKRMWIPYQRGYPIVLSQLEALRPIASAAGVSLEEFPADNAAELKVELDRRAKSADVGIDAILFVAEPLTVTADAFEVMGRFAAGRKLPIGGALMSAGGYESMFGVNVSIAETGVQAAHLAAQILDGVPPANIPVVSAESFIQINYRAARKCGLEVNEILLSMADEVIR